MLPFPKMRVKTWSICWRSSGMSWAVEPTPLYAPALFWRDGPTTVVEDFLQVLPGEVQFLMPAVDPPNTRRAPNAPSSAALVRGALKSGTSRIPRWREQVAAGNRLIAAHLRDYTLNGRTRSSHHCKSYHDLVSVDFPLCAHIIHSAIHSDYLIPD